MGKKADEDNRDDLTVAYMVGYEHGKKNLSAELVKFFRWFRDNGEKYIGITVEELVNKYIEERLG